MTEKTLLKLIQNNPNLKEDKYTDFYVGKIFTNGYMARNGLEFYGRIYLKIYNIKIYCTPLNILDLYFDKKNENIQHIECDFYRDYDNYYAKNIYEYALTLLKLEKL